MSISGVLPTDLALCKLICPKNNVFMLYPLLRLTSYTPHIQSFVFCLSTLTVLLYWIPAVLGTQFPHQTSTARLELECGYLWCLNGDSIRQILVKGTAALYTSNTQDASISNRPDSNWPDWEQQGRGGLWDVSCWHRGFNDKPGCTPHGWLP